MSISIDPYRQWLSVDDPERPPNHYRLLGLAVFEDDAEKIWSEAMRRMAVVLEHDPGPHCELARQLFDELEMARTCLSDPRRKQKYDDSLRQHLKNIAEHADIGTNVVGLKAPLGRSSASAKDASASASTLSNEHSSSTTAAITPRVRASGAWDSNRSIVVAALAVIVALLAISLNALWNGWEPAESDRVAPLLVQLSSRDATQRIEAARSLRALGPQAYQAIPALFERLREDRSDEVRMAAAEALAACGATLSASTAEIDQILATEIDPAVRAILEPWASDAARR